MPISATTEAIVKIRRIGDLSVGTLADDETPERGKGSMRTTHRSRFSTPFAPHREGATGCGPFPKRRATLPLLQAITQDHSVRLEVATTLRHRPLPGLRRGRLRA